MATSTTIVNGAFIYILAVSLLLFFMIVFFMVYCLVRYRSSRNPVPEELPQSVLVEAVWVIVPTIIALSMFLYGLTGFRFLRAAPRDSYVVKVHSRQWSWLFEYPNGKKSADMVVPLGKNIKCEITSIDVLHSFYVPAFRIQENAIPGFTTMAWFKAVSPGSYYILCAQYCGLQHSRMLAKLIVVPEDRFNSWLEGGALSVPNGGEAAAMPVGQSLIYERGCISCHSLEGSAMVGPTLKGLFGSKVTVMTAGSPREVVADSAYIRKSILVPAADVTAGFSNTMPSGRDILSDGEIGEIISYLETIR